MLCCKCSKYSSTFTLYSCIHSPPTRSGDSGSATTLTLSTTNNLYRQKAWVLILELGKKCIEGFPKLNTKSENLELRWERGGRYCVLKFILEEFVSLHFLKLQRPISTFFFCIPAFVFVIHILIDDPRSIRVLNWQSKCSVSMSVFNHYTQTGSTFLSSLTKY